MMRCALIPVLLLLASTAGAAPDTTLSANLGVSLFGLGLTAGVFPGVKVPLWNKEGNVLLEDTWVWAEYICTATPSYSRQGVRLRWSPIAVMELEGHAIISPYFGTFSSIIGFDSPDAAHTDDEIEAASDAGGRGTGWATNYGGDATLQGKVGPIILALSGGWAKWDVHPAANVSGEYFFEPEYEVLLGWHDQTLSGTGVLLFAKEWDKPEGRRLLVGSMTSYRQGVSAHDEMLRTGLIGVFRFDMGWQALLIVQPYLKSRPYPTFPPYIAAQAKRTFK